MLLPLFTNKGEYDTVNVTPTILILTAKYGSGHMQAAKALATEFEKRGYYIVISDLIEESYPSISQMTQQLLIKSYIYGQTFYKWFYYGTNKINGTFNAQASVSVIPPGFVIKQDEIEKSLWISFT